MVSMPVLLIGWYYIRRKVLKWQVRHFKRVGMQFDINKKAKGMMMYSSLVFQETKVPDGPKEPSSPKF